MNGYLLFVALVGAVLWGLLLWRPRYLIALQLVVLALLIALVHRGPDRFSYLKRTYGVLTGRDDGSDWREP